MPFATVPHSSTACKVRNFPWHFNEWRYDIGCTFMEAKNACGDELKPASESRHQGFVFTSRGELEWVSICTISSAHPIYIRWRIRTYIWHGYLTTTAPTCNNDPLGCVISLSRSVSRRLEARLLVKNHGICECWWFIVRSCIPSSSYIASIQSAKTGFVMKTT